MRQLISWPYLLCFITIVLVASWVLNQGFGTGFWITAGIVALAILVNGFIAAFEDDQPGGFNVPDSESEDRRDD